MINIGKIINRELKDIVGGRCYPIVAELQTKMPFMIYNRTSSFPQDTKDYFIYQWNHSVQVRIVTEKYDEGIEILQQVIDKMYALEERTDDEEIGEVMIDSIQEDWENDAYIQSIIIKIKTK